MFRSGERPAESESGKEEVLGKRGGVQRGTNKPTGTSEKLHNEASVGGAE